MATTVGQYGKIKFTVSSRKVFTFSDMEREQSGRWKDHDISGSAPLSEFVGPDATTMSLKISLKAQLGVNPRKEIKELEGLARNGTYDTLAIGGKLYGWGDGKWRVASVTDKWDRFIGGGLQEAGCTVNFVEYTEAKDRVVKKVAAKAAKPSAAKKKAKKSVNLDDIARRVIRGEFGNGQARFSKLTASGYDWKAVQNKVNEILGCKKRYK